MMTVHEVSKLAGVSIRTLQYYDKIGLLRPTGHTDAGYRLYDDADLERLQHILLFRELEFPLKDIGRILSSPNFDRKKALEQQIELLRLKRDHLERLIEFAQGLKKSGGKKMDFSAFDKSKLDAYAKEAKAKWGDTAEYKEFEEKSRNRSDKDNKLFVEQFMLLFKEAGEIKDKDPGSPEAQDLVKRIQEYITKNMYNCTKEILSGLGKMYSAGGEFTENIDMAGGEGTGAFVDKAIQIYCS